MRCWQVKKAADTPGAHAHTITANNGMFDASRSRKIDTPQGTATASARHAVRASIQYVCLVTRARIPVPNSWGLPSVGVLGCVVAVSGNDGDVGGVQGDGIAFGEGVAGEEVRSVKGQCEGVGGVVVVEEEVDVSAAGVFEARGCCEG